MLGVALDAHGVAGVVGRRAARPPAAVDERPQQRTGAAPTRAVHGQIAAHLTAMYSSVGLSVSISGNRTP